jgi:hypothetical protein
MDRYRRVRRSRLPFRAAASARCRTPRRSSSRHRSPARRRSAERAAVPDRTRRAPRTGARLDHAVGAAVEHDPPDGVVPSAHQVRGLCLDRAQPGVPMPVWVQDTSLPDMNGGARSSAARPHRDPAPVAVRSGAIAVARKGRGGAYVRKENRRSARSTDTWRVPATSRPTTHGAIDSSETSNTKKPIREHAPGGQRGEWCERARNVYAEHAGRGRSSPVTARPMFCDELSAAAIDQDRTSHVEWIREFRGTPISCVEENRRNLLNESFHASR